VKRETVNLRAESDWKHSQSDAENQCDERLDILEDEAISQASSNGGEYVQGSTSSYSIDYNSSTDLFKCTRERTLEFEYPEKENLIKQIELVDYEEHKNIKLINNVNSKNNETPINVTSTLEAIIQPKVPAIITATYFRLENEFSPYDNITLSRRVPYTVNLPLTAIKFNHLNIISSSLLLDSDAYTINIPMTETVLHFPYYNCSSMEQSVRRDVEFKIVRGWKIEFTKTITSATKIGGKLKFGSDGEADISLELKSEIKNHKSISETKEEAIKTSYPFNIAANKIVDIKLIIQNFEARRNYNGPIILDGEVVLIYGQEEKKNVKQLSSILNEQERTIHISGYYANINWEEVPINITQKDCP
jgi:hypothetical protein